MKLSASVLVCLMVAGSQHTFARQQSDDLNDQQRLGRQILAQSCGVCHLPPSLKAQTYGPPLTRGTAGGNEALVRSTILDGTPRMPAFKYYLQPAEIDAIIAYVKTIPAPASTAAAPR